MKKNLVRAAFSLLMLTYLTTSAYPQWIQTNWQAGNDFFNLYSNEDVVFARIWDSLNSGRVFFTDDDGANWAQISSADDDIDILSLVMLNKQVLAGTWDSFYRSTLENISWEFLAPTGIPQDTPIWSTVMIGDTLFAGAKGKIYKSSINDPNTWTETGTGIPANARIMSIIENGNAIFAGSDSNGVFLTTDGGTNWIEFNSGLTDLHISQLVAIGTKMYAITLIKGVFVIDINSISWAADNSGIDNVNCFLPADNLLFAGTDGNGVYISNDSGLNWASVDSGMSTNTRVWSLAASGDNIFAGTSEGVFRINPADINNYTIAASATDGGTISPEGDITVYETGSRTFTVTPELGYLINDVLVDGNSVGAVNSYTFSNVTADHTISASFKEVPIYTITASAGNGGTISPSGEVQVSGGSSQEFTITPFEGYAIYSVTVDGNSVGIVSTYTFTDIAENHTISVTFEVAPFIITASAGTGGSISPSGNVEVWGGESQTFTITPSNGYEISDVLIDGVPFGAISSYTFTSVSSNHTINASFNSLTVYQINCSGGDVPPFTADQYYSGGNTWSSSNAIDTTGVTDSAPEAVYQTLRWGFGGFTYTLPNLTIGASYKVRLHFSEGREVAAYDRIFNVTINETTVLSNYNIYSAAGDINKAVAEEFTTTANTSGQIVIQFTAVSMQPAIAGIEIIKQQ